MRNERGFTLVEVMFALTIMAVSFGTILSIQVNSSDATAKAAQMTVVALLAKNMMIETEYMIEGKAFSEMKAEEEGVFPEPNQDYKWKRVVKEIKFPNLNIAGSNGDAAKGAAEDSGDQSAGMLAKLVANFFSKAMREVTITVSWKKAGGEKSYSVSTYWVNLNNEFQLSQ